MWVLSKIYCFVWIFPPFTSLTRCIERRLTRVFENTAIPALWENLFTMGVDRKLRYKYWTFHTVRSEMFRNGYCHLRVSLYKIIWVSLHLILRVISKVTSVSVLIYCVNVLYRAFILGLQCRVCKKSFSSKSTMHTVQLYFVDNAV